MTFFRLLLKLNFIFILATPLHAEDHSRSRYLMGTLLTISAPVNAQYAVTAAFRTVADAESWMSTHRSESELSQLNAKAGSGPVLVSKPLWDMLMEAKKYWQLSNGTFDPAYRSKGGFIRIIFNADSQSVSLPKGVDIDLGGIGKGWALDRAAETLRAHGVTSAQLNFGGQILVFSPSLKSETRLVEVADPACHRAALSTSRSLCSTTKMNITNGSISTSGMVERPAHIIDPNTGESSPRLGSISIAAQSATAADAWSTAVFVGGLNQLPKSLCALEINNKNTVWHGDCKLLRRTS